MVRGKRPGDRYVRIVRAEDMAPRSPASEYVLAEPTEPTTHVGRLVRSVRRVLIGRPLESSHAIHERLSKTKALAVFSSDALSSTAYATEEVLLLLVLAGTAAYSYLIPIGVAIVALLAIVVFSYSQTIAAYPHGGGSYIVTKDNLGRTPSLVAASALLTGYILTVAVSVSAGVAAITSAFDGLYPHRVAIAVAAVVLMTIANLRGVSESGTIFAVPTYLFIGSMAVLLALGFASWLGIGPTPHAVGHGIPAAVQPLSLVLVLRAFAAGCAALTGVEAIADGVPAFKEPQAANAARTLVAMGLILGVLFLGVTFLVRHFGLTPSSDETLLSLLTRSIVGTSPFYYVIQAATTGILILGANTAFADFPRLNYFLARDNFVPHRFLSRGDRLAYSTGIIVLAISAAVLIALFAANVSSLIPIYAVGVFVAFTMSQSSMTFRWWRSPRSHRRTTGLLINGLGATVTAVVVLINITTRFLDGAWVVLVLLPLIISQLLAIRRHYDRVDEQLRITPETLRAEAVPFSGDSAVVVPLDKLNQASIRAIRYAQWISDDVTAVHVTDDEGEAEELTRAWDAAGLDLPLVILQSPYRELIGPLVNYIEHLHDKKGGAVLTVVLPEFVPAHLYEIPLHTQTAWRLRTALWSHEDIVVTSIPYHLER